LPPGRVVAVGAAAVVEGDIEQHPAAACGALDAEVELALYVVRELILAADDTKTDVVREQRLELGSQIPLEQQHQRIDLGARALPVLDGKRVQREHADAEPR